MFWRRCHPHPRTYLTALATVLVGGLLILSYRSSWSFTPRSWVDIGSDSEFLECSWGHHTNNKIKNNQRDQPSFKPIVFNAGQGTTGTRAVKHALCHLGVPSIHYLYSCNVNLTRGQKQDIYNFGLPPGSHHELVKKGFTRASISWLDRSQHCLEEIIAAGQADGLMDTPFTYYSSYILSAAERIRGVAPIVLVSERDPIEWAKKRTEEHGNVPLCQPAKYEKSAKANVFYLDYGVCLQEAKKVHQDREQPELVLWQATHLLKSMGQDAGMKAIADAFDRYQSTMRQRADFSFNLFTHVPRLDTEGWAKELSEAIPEICKHWSCPSGNIDRAKPTENGIQDNSTEIVVTASDHVSNVSSNLLDTSNKSDSIGESEHIMENNNKKEPGSH